VLYLDPQVSYLNNLKVAEELHFGSWSKFARKFAPSALERFSYSYNVQLHSSFSLQSAQKNPRFVFSALYCV